MREGDEMRSSTVVHRRYCEIFAELQQLAGYEHHHDTDAAQAVHSNIGRDLDDITGGLSMPKF